MSELNVFKDVGLAILAASIFAIPAYFLKIPLLLAYLAGGIVLGPHLGLGVIEGTEAILSLSKIGMILLMFILGLEIDVRRLAQAGKAVAVNGITQFFGCVGLGFIYFSLLGFRNSGSSMELTYLSVACSLSSTLIVIKILSERMELSTFLSRVTVGVLVFQDLWAISFLAIQPNLTGFNLTSLIVSLTGAIFLIGFCWTIARFILPFLFTRVAKQTELMLLLAIAWCFMIAGMAHSLHLSMEMGALLAGVMVASLPYHTDIGAKLASLRDFFTTLFFVALGLQIPKPTPEVISLAAAISGFVIFSRVLTMYPVLYLMKYGNRCSLIPAINLSQLSELSLVIGALGVGYGHIRQELLSAFVLALAFTVMLSSIMITDAHQIYRRLNPLLERLGLRDRIVSFEEEEAAQSQNHPQIVLIGFFREASSLLHEILARHSPDAKDKILVVDFNPESHERLIELGVRCKYGDISNEQTLANLKIEKAKILVCTIPDHNLKGTTNLKLLRALKKIAPEARVVVTAETLGSAREMYIEGADYVFVSRIITAHYLADVIGRMTLGENVVIRHEVMEYFKGRREALE